MTLVSLFVRARRASGILSTTGRNHHRQRVKNGSLMSTTIMAPPGSSDKVLWNSCGSRRFQSTTSASVFQEPFDLSEKVVEGSGKVLETFQTPLEFMAAHSTISSGGAGTIFSDMGAVIWTSEVLCSIKDCLGMSWIQTIFFGTIVIRLLVGVPIAVSQQKAIAKLEDMQPQFKKLANDLKAETGLAIRTFGWDEKTAKRQFIKSYKKHWRKMVEDENCHPMKSLCLGLLQVPVWICFSSAIRNLVYGLPAPTTNDQAIRWAQFHSESLPWVDSLTLCDPVVFPAVFLAANLTNIRLNSMLKKSGQQPSQLQKSLPWVFGAAVVGISFLACYVPSAVSMYWAVSSSTALVQNIMMKQNVVRRLLRLKPMQ